MKKKKIVALALIMALVLPFRVNAKTYSSVSELMNDMPDSISVKYTSIEVVKDKSMFAELNDYLYDYMEKEVESKITYTDDVYACKNLSTGEDETCTDKNIVIGDKKYYLNYYNTLGAAMRVELWERRVHGTCSGDECLTDDVHTYTKDIRVSYADDNKFNQSDNDQVMKIANFLNPQLVSSYTKEIMDVEDSYYKLYLNKTINDKSIVVYENTVGGGGDGDMQFVAKEIYLAKNDVVYASMSGDHLFFNTVIVPNTVANTDTAYINAAMSEIKKIWNRYTVTGVKRITDRIIDNYAYNDGTFYKVLLSGDDCEEGSECYARVRIKKNSQVKIMDGVLIDDVLGLAVSGSDLANTNNVYKTMDTNAKNKGYGTAIKAVNFTVIKGILNEKAKLVIDVGSNYNGKQVLVTSKKGTGYEYINTYVRSDGRVYVDVSELGPLMISLATNVPITSVKINQTNPTVVIKKTTKLTATVNPSNTTQSKTLTWSSSNTKIATVDKNGVVKGIKAGTATITVKTSNGKTASVKVTVKKATPIKSVKLNKSSAKLELNKTLQLKATVSPSNTTDDKTVTWSSSNNKIVTVDKNGKITAIKAGTAKITVKTSNGKKKTIKVTVSKINAKKAKISAIANQIQTGKALKPSVTVTLNGKTLKSGTDYTVTYKNNKNAGKATVTVKFKGNYTGSVKSTFLIIPKKVAIKNPSTTKKTITVKYTKVTGAKTYQIAYRLKGTDKWSYTTKTKISKLTSGKEYEVCVRAGIKSGSKTLYGAWSDTKVINVK